MIQSLRSNSLNPIEKSQWIHASQYIKREMTAIQIEEATFDFEF
jgi:hypothetical protein